MTVFVRLDVSLRTVSICVVEADGTVVWEGKTTSEPLPLVERLAEWGDRIRLVGIEACPLSEWLYGALVESGFETVCIETRHAQRFLSSRPNKTDRSDARGIADMMRLGHYRPVHVKSRASQLLRTTLIARKRFVDHMLAMEGTIRGLLKVHGLKIGAVHRSRFGARVETLLARPAGIAPGDWAAARGPQSDAPAEGRVRPAIGASRPQGYGLLAADDDLRRRADCQLGLQGDDR